VESYANPEAASKAGAGYTRIILRWDVIQPAGRDDWKPANVPDPIIEGERAAGREIVGLLIGTPAWAQAASFGEREGDEPPPTSSRAVPDLFHWEAFVRRVAQQYQGRISHWIIWNEPDVWMEGHPGRTWDGTVEEYALLLKTAYLAIKDVDPSMEVHIAGLTYFWDWEHGRRQYLDRLLEALVADPQAAASGFYFDAVVYHLYFKPQQTAQILAEVRNTLERYGIRGKSIWINETNAPPSDDPQEPPWSPPRFRISQEEQAAFILQEFALAFASGASRVEVYKLQNTAEHPESIEPYGLLRADDSPRPAYTAYQVATTYLSGFQEAYRQQEGAVEAVTFQRPNQTTTVLWTWSRQPTRVNVRAITSQALLVDEKGNTQAVPAVDGRYTITLPGAICSDPTGCFIGGTPRMLVEAAGEAGQRVALIAPSPATSTATATPAMTQTPPSTATMASAPTQAQSLTSTSATAPTPTLSLTSSATPLPTLASSPEPTPSPTPLPSSTPTSSPAPGTGELSAQATPWAASTTGAKNQNPTPVEPSSALGAETFPLAQAFGTLLPAGLALAVLVAGLLLAARRR
jgi:hypothetical protein